MDRFALFLGALELTGQGVLHVSFVCRLTGKKRKFLYDAVYLPVLYALAAGVRRWAGLWPLTVCLALPALYGVSRLLLQNGRAASCAGAGGAVYIAQLSSGLVNAAQAVLFPAAVGTPLLYPLDVLAVLLGFAVCAGCYAAVLRLNPLSEDGRLPGAGVLLAPGAFCLAAQLYILRTAYSALPRAVRPGTHAALLLLQGGGLAALLCTLYAYRRMRESARMQAEVQSLAQAVRAQKVYVAEARARCEQTKAFRHDIKNHLTVLDGLLQSGKTAEGRALLQTLEAACTALSFPYQTGHPVADILLGEKLAAARADGVTAQVSLRLPCPCGIDDYDLCVLFANALDNALCACRRATGERTVYIGGKRQGDFQTLSFENTCDGGPLPPPGTGLANIRAVAEKYHGAMLTEKADGRFSLHVLLNIAGQISTDETGENADFLKG